VKPTLVIFVKEPRPGRVKTRLGAGIGMAAAAQWFRVQSGALIRRLSGDPRWETILAVAPDGAVASRVWPEGVALWPQGAGDLGDRMTRALRRFGPGPVMIIGADIPGIEARHIAEAAKALRTHDAVFGPAPDGGYWLVGALSDTLATLPKDARIARLEVLRDVDTVDDLKPDQAT